MTTRYDFPARIVLHGDENLASRYVGEARVLLGALMEELGEQNLHVGQRKRSKNGVKIEVAYDGTSASIRIDTSGTRSRVTSQERTDIFIPHGFVVYPASDIAPSGWGTPIIPLATYPVPGPYDDRNTAPGLDVLRWTPGGPLGQVLISGDVNAGYTEKNRLLVPLMYDLAFGPKLKRAYVAPAQADNIGAWRLEFTDFSGQSPLPVEAWPSLEVTKRTIFELVNERRAELGRDPIALPIRGEFDSAQISAEICFTTRVLAHMSDAFPIHWKTNNDQYQHDGVLQWEPTVWADSRSHNSVQNVAAVGYPPVNLIGHDSNGVDIYSIPNGGPVFSGAQAFDFWMHSPPHRATIESVEWDGFATSTSIGARQNYAAQNFLKHEQWIATGNRSWASTHDDVPILSWFGFAALNLAWETWPMTYASAATCPAPVDPLTALGPLVSVDGIFWLKYTYAAKLGVHQKPIEQPALDSRIFSRGRCIAIAPHGGLVWAAAIQKFEGQLSTDTPVYRLITLVHHEADQTGVKTNGMTSHVHVWYCDLPYDPLLPCKSPAIIRGVYGHELDGTSYPWDEINNVCSWRDGGKVDVGTSDGITRDLLKYGSQWVFSPDGMKAACLRDTGVYSDYLTRLWPGHGGRCYDYYDSKVYEFGGLEGSAIELTFTGGLQAEYTVAKQWLGRCATAYNPPAYTNNEYIFPGITNGEEVNAQDYDVYAAPIAAGYDANGILKFAKHVSALATTSSWLYRDYYEGISFGAYNSAWTSNFIGFASAGCGNVGGTESTWLSTFQILDVADEVVFSVGRRSFFTFYYVGGALLTSVNHWFTTNWYQTAEHFTNVRVWRDGVLLHEQTYPMPDGAVIDMKSLCYQNTPVAPGGGDTVSILGVINILSTSANCLASYAVDKSGEWIASYSFLPQAHVSFAVGVPSCVCAREILNLSLPAYSCKPHVADLVTRGDTTCVTRGGWMTSSFAEATALADLVGATGTNPRFLYARVV